MTSPKNTGKARANVTTTEPGSGAALQPATQAPAKKATKVAPPASTSVAKPKPKLVRDSFTIPKSEYAVLDGLKLRAANLTRPVKKSELLRAGVAVLHAMGDKAFLAALNAVPSLKTGRPKGVDASSPPGKSTK